MAPLRFLLLCGLLALSTMPSSIDSYLLPRTASSPVRAERTMLFDAQNQRSDRPKNTRKSPLKKMTIAELRNQLLKNPELLQQGNQNKKKYRRTRRRVEQPQQSYVYAAQRKQLPQDPKEPRDSEDGADASPAVAAREEFHSLALAREFGLVNAAMQHCDPLVDQIEPQILGTLRVGDSGSEQFAYMISKPAGWSIIGNSKSNAGDKGSNAKNTEEKADTTIGSKPKSKQKVKIKSGSKEEYLEFDEDDILALLTPEERAEWEAQGGLGDDFGKKPVYDDEIDLPTVDIPGWYDVLSLSPEEREEACIDDNDFDPDDIPQFDEADMLALMNEEERVEYEKDKLAAKVQQNISLQPGVKTKKNKYKNPLQRYLDMPREDMDEKMLENLKRIERRLGEQSSTKASFAMVARPSVVNWLKDLKASEGTPIRGGNFWTPVAGATEVDDSGLVLLCPKSQTSNVFVDATSFITVVGNGEYLAPPPKRKDNVIQVPKEQVEMEIYSKVRKGRDGDLCQTVRVTVSESPASGSSIVQHVQSQFADGIRGDPAANPFDRRASRRLIHCRSLSVSSLSHDDDSQAQIEVLPDDIAILAERLNHHKYVKGSFLGRSELRENTLTNAYREINGAADGFPGWTVDRYSQWLFVQHDPKEYRGPLPSIHDGNTAGVYYLAANPDRGSMGSDSSLRPTLLEGKAAPELVPIVENGVRYCVSLDKDLSTGIFLDQRPQRAWLSRNCHQKTHLLNCFAHCGAFSIAAASAGASTVSLDLSKKWLDRVKPQLEANGIPFDERHDCIYGDCFDWLEKLGKRGEKFDIVILDPPSSSVGKKKRRWSVKNDMDELVALAAPLVKPGGLLWTTTNSAGLSPIKFARLCKRGLDQVGLENAKLERLQPMPLDFPSIGAQPVKNLVWRIP